MDHILVSILECAKRMCQFSLCREEIKRMLGFKIHDNLLGFKILVQYFR